MVMAAVCSDTPGRHSRSWTDGGRVMQLKTDVMTLWGA
jgi:hypothetical protein